MTYSVFRITIGFNKTIITVILVRLGINSSTLLKIHTAKIRMLHPSSQLPCVLQIKSGKSQLNKYVHRKHPAKQKTYRNTEIQPKFNTFSQFLILLEQC